MSNYEEIRKLRAENKNLKKLARAYEKLCVAYRTGATKTPEKSLDLIAKYKHLLEPRK